MCKEFQEELDRHSELAKQLVQGMLDHGAAACAIPIVINDETYVVRITHEPISDKENVQRQIHG